MANGAEAAALKEIMGAGARLGHPEVISLLRSALADAEQGKILGVAMIMITKPGASQSAATPGFQMEMVCGAEMLKLNLLGSMQGRASPIVRAG